MKFLKNKNSDLTRPENFILVHGVSIGLCFLAAVLTKVITPLFDTHFFEFFQAAVVLSAWYGGMSPGILSAAISTPVIAYFFIPPIHSFSLHPIDFLRLIIFAAVAVLTSSLSGKLKRAYDDLEVTHQKLERAHDELEVRIAERTQELSKANNTLKKEIGQRLEAEKAILDISHREQRRLGQDLHDGLCQILAGVRFMTQGVKDELQEQSKPEAKKLSIIDSELGNALAYVDTVSRGLYPVELDTKGLVSALEELGEKTSKVYPVNCRVKFNRANIHVESAVANHLYRIAQESLMNAIKSGKASSVTIKLFQTEKKLRLRIIDNGIGLGNAPKRNGMGIKMMEYRARVINADLRFQSRPTGVTWVRCELNNGDCYER